MVTLSFWQVLGLGVGLALVIEGSMPFASPAKWRQLFTQIQQLSDGQVRFFGMVSIGIGLLIVVALMP